MEELDATVRENQLSSLPISKSGRAEAELFERYPDLAIQLDRARQAKIDSLMLHSRLHEDEAKAEKLSKHNAAATKSPSLKARMSSTELLFHMDEESAASPHLGRSPVSPSLEAHRSRPPNEEDWHLQTPPSRNRIGHEVGQPHGSVSPTVGSVPAVNIPSPGTNRASFSESGSPTPSRKIPADSLSPWGYAGLNTSKLDMKQIMAQASESRQSNISSAISSAGNTSAFKTPGSGKISQKERKKQQQLQREQAATSSLSNSPSINVASKQSPWQIASPGPKVSLSEVLNSNSSPQGPTTPIRPSGPPLTLRQTVPGNVPTSRKISEGSIPKTQSPQPKRTVSQPLPANDRPPLIPVRDHPSTSSTAQTVATPGPRSVRYNMPITPAEPSLQLSMADILAQQQTEKDILKDAIAKRSLLEIQEEQAFQEWWDQEEKATKARMLEEEEAAKARKDQKTRGNRRGRRGGKSVKADTPANTQVGEASSKGKASGGSRVVNEKPNREVHAERGRSVRRGRRGGA
jgi:inhibitor of Bruton tyrosine kinase